MSVTTHLRSLQALELAVRLGSLQAAAEALSITPAAVGQRVKALEDYLGVDLLVRGRTGLKPTAALAAALGNLEAAFRELATAADVLDMQRGHEIHVAAVSDFADLWLKPRLERFRRSYPNVLFCLNGEGDAALRLGPVDCEISFGRVGDDTGGDVLFHDVVLPIASPENTRRIARLKPRERLEGFPLLHVDFYRDDPLAPGWPGWIRARRLKRTAPERGMRFQRIVPALEAVLANAGIALCGLALLDGHLDDGRVSLPFPIRSGVTTAHAFRARFHGAALSRPQVRRFRTWLMEEGALTKVWLERLVHRRATRRAPA